MNKKIIFRADGTPSIGMGHFTRTLALAEMLNENFHCIYATRIPTDYQIAEIAKICNSRIDLPEEDSHFEVFLNHLNGNEIVVLDNYYFTIEYQKAIKAKGCKLICIDDMHDKHFVADVVINHAEGIDPKVYSIEKYTRLLIGYKYALIRKNYRKPANETNEKKYACMVMMGGSDPLNLTTGVIEKLAKLNVEIPIAVVTEKSDETYKIIEGSGKFVFFKNLAAGQVAHLMQSSVFGIFPASTVALEACAIRLPFLCGYFTDNQKEIYASINTNKLAVCVGDFTTNSNNEIIEAVTEISMPGMAKTIIHNQSIKMDNQSDKRLLKEFQNLWK
jgi:UDP-2,4-diacetamido-2,4,6-trideoxy-beta-L-altropyranose hydrolase